MRRKHIAVALLVTSSAFSLCGCEEQQQATIGELVTQNLCMLAKSPYIIEGDVVGWTGLQRFESSMGWFNTSGIKVSVVRTYKGSLPATLEVFGAGDIDSSGNSSVGPLSEVNGVPRRAIFFMVRAPGKPYFLSVLQGYFWPDEASGLLKNTWRYQQGVPRAEIEAAIEAYSDGGGDGVVACPWDYWPPQYPFGSDGGAGWRDAGP